jgi:hypothetical protein
MLYKLLTIIEVEIDSYLRGNHSREFGIALLELKTAIEKIKKFL